MSATLDGKTSISTHAPAGGATSFVMEIMAFSTLFLLTPLREGRPDVAAVLVKDLVISTHAPAGGATRPSTRQISCPTHFYSRPCGRGDARSQRQRRSEIFYFYSRPCGRGDDLHDEGVRRLCHFYSRPCGRGDRLFVCFYNGRRRFLLTPLREGQQQFSTSPS